jgi:hypothetical protein
MHSRHTLTRRTHERIHMEQTLDTSVGWVRRKSRGYKRRYTGGESSRSSMRVGVDSDLPTTAHPPHAEVTLKELLLPTPIGVLFPPLRACVGTARWQQGKRAWPTLQVSLRGRGRRAQPLPHPPHTPHASLSVLLTWCAKTRSLLQMMEAGISKHPQNIPQNKTL